MQDFLSNITIIMKIREVKVMKRIFLIMFALLFTMMCANAKANYLHNITLEKSDSGFNIILNTDTEAKLTRRLVSDNELVLELNGITSSDTVNALYKGTEDIDNLVVENVSANKLKIYITAPNIAKSSVIMQTLDGGSALVGESFPVQKTVWAVFVILVATLMYKSSKKRSIETNRLLTKRNIKDREIELYRKYREEMDRNSSNKMNEYRMKNMLKKIDRRIDERLSASLK